MRTLVSITLFNLSVVGIPSVGLYTCNSFSTCATQRSQISEAQEMRLTSIVIDDVGPGFLLPSAALLLRRGRAAARAVACSGGSPWTDPP